MTDPQLIALVVDVDETLRKPEVWVTVLRGKLADGDDVWLFHADGRQQRLRFTGVGRRPVTNETGTGLGGVAHAGPFEQREVREGRFRIGDLLMPPDPAPVDVHVTDELMDAIRAAKDDGRNQAGPHVPDDVIALHVQKVLTDAAHHATGPVVGSAAYEHASTTLAFYGLRDWADRALLVAAALREGRVTAPTVRSLARLVPVAGFDTTRLVATLGAAAVQGDTLGVLQHRRLAAKARQWREELVLAGRALAVGWCAKCNDLRVLDERMACERCGTRSTRAQVVVPADREPAEDELRAASTA